MAVNKGPKSLTLTQDADGNRVYKVPFRVAVEDGEGPISALFADGLPLPGDVFAFGADVDVRARCRLEVVVTPDVSGEPTPSYTVEFTFSSKPLSHCQEDVVYEDPLLEPWRITFGSRKEKIEAPNDRDGYPILTSSFEPIRGPQVEFDASVSVIEIQSNVAEADRHFTEARLDCLNEDFLWGYPPGTVKFSAVKWERKFYDGCSCYFSRSLTFEYNPRGWDRKVLDESTKVIAGDWNAARQYVIANIPLASGVPASRTNPSHFKKALDYTGNQTRLILDGEGAPADVVVSTNGKWLSIDDGNVGHGLTEDAWWLPIVGNPAGTLFDGLPRNWKRGEIVKTTEEYYYVIKDVPDDDVSEPFEAPDNYGLIGFLPPSNEGTYAAGTTYELGAYVGSDGSVKGPGRIVVRYYQLVDLSLLNIPATLGCE